MVENPTDVEINYNIAEVYDFANGVPFHLTQSPSLSGSPVDYVVITTDELKDDFTNLVDLKHKK